MADAGHAQSMVTIHHVTVDCRDPYGLASFWSQVTGWPVHPDDGPEDDEVSLVPPEHGPDLLFIRVPEPKSVKNRLHLDLMPVGRTRDEDVERLVRLGARVSADHRNPDGTGWVTLVDQEGNEFCVERSAAERAR
jgi:hypothetical protein